MFEFHLDTQLKLKNDLITKAELAKILRISTATITNQMYQGREGIDLPFAIKLGRHYRWHKDSVAKFLSDKEQERKILLTKSSCTELCKPQINRI